MSYFEITNRTNQRRKFLNNSQQYVNYISQMMHNEPVIKRCLDLIRSHILMKGIQCQLGEKFTTNDFDEFINTFYTPFCQDAIQSMMAVGFVPWRMRSFKHNGAMETIPEVLPLGTYEWTVVPIKKDNEVRARYEDSASLQYSVTSLSYKTEDVHVYTYDSPDMTMECVSGMSRLITMYIRLLMSRECKSRCEEWNSSVKIAVENSEKNMINTLAEDGGFINSTNITTQLGIEMNRDNLSESTSVRKEVVDLQAQKANLPYSTKVFVPPKNHSVRNLDPVDPPSALPEMELEFQRGVCYAFGVPCNMVVQHYTLSTHSSSSGSSNEYSSYNMLSFQNTCKHIAKHLCLLLRACYHKIYDSIARRDHKKKREEVTFFINCTPILDLERIYDLHYRQFVDDEVINDMLMATLGYPMNKKAKRLPADNADKLQISKDKQTTEREKMEMQLKKSVDSSSE